MLWSLEGHDDDDDNYDDDDDDDDDIITVSRAKRFWKPIVFSTSKQSAIL